MIDDETIIRRIASAVIEEDRAQHLRCQRGEHAMLGQPPAPVWSCAACAARLGCACGAS